MTSLTEALSSVFNITELSDAQVLKALREVKADKGLLACVVDTDTYLFLSQQKGTERVEVCIREGSDDVHSVVLAAEGFKRLMSQLRSIEAAMGVSKKVEQPLVVTPPKLGDHLTFGAIDSVGDVPVCLNGIMCWLTPSKAPSQGSLNISATTDLANHLGLSELFSTNLIEALLPQLKQLIEDDESLTNYAWVKDEQTGWQNGKMVKKV